MIRARFEIAMVLALAIGVVVAGCGHDPTVQQQSTAQLGARLNADYTDAGKVPGALTDATTLTTIDRRLRSVTAVAARIEYTSTSGITGGNTQVTGTVFAPMGKPPEGGWPIVAFAHATTGVQADCAPSLSPTLLGTSGVVTTLVNAGFVVSVPDYQGLGSDREYHPYLDSTTAGYNVIDSVRAARRLVPAASNRWVGIGLSQGGQATWAANELSADYSAGLSLRGTVSLAPPADISGFADAAAAGSLTNEQAPALAAILASLKKEHPEFNLDDYRRGLVQEKWDMLLSCQAQQVRDRAKVIADITADDLRPSTPEAVEALRGYLQKMSLPQGPAVAPMLVIYGGNDNLVPPSWIERALATACGMGDVIDIRFQPDKGHTDLDVSSAYGWLTDRLKNVPAPNSCSSFLAAQRLGARGDNRLGAPG